MPSTTPKLEFSPFFIIDKWNLRDKSCLDIKTPYGFLPDGAIKYLTKVGLKITLMNQDKTGSYYKVSKHDTSRTE